VRTEVDGRVVERVRQTPTRPVDGVAGVLPGEVGDEREPARGADADAVQKEERRPLAGDEAVDALDGRDVHGEEPRLHVDAVVGGERRERRVVPRVAGHRFRFAPAG